jgi:glycosyltransferase involved in cell wall biosynthesis
MNDKADPRHFPNAVNIVDFDDAHFLDPGLKDEIVEKCRQCDAAIGGSRFTEAWLKQHVDDTLLLWTCSPHTQFKVDLPASARERRVVWGTTSPLQAKMEADLVREVVHRCAAKAEFELLIVGNGSQQEVDAFFGPELPGTIKITHKPLMDYDSYINCLSQCAVALAPLHVSGETFNAGKSFGKILAYIAAEVPVIASNVVDHAMFLEHGTNGFLVDNVNQWSDHVVELLGSPETRDKLASNAKRDLQEKMSLEFFSQRLYKFALETAASC